VDKKEIDVFDAFQETLRRLDSPGALLVAGREKPNLMAIGWGSIGIIWGKPIFVVLVRPSRFTHGLMESWPEFTVNIPSPDMDKTVDFCGSKSGRDVDKVAMCGLTLEPGHKIEVPSIAECPIHYECRTVHKNNVIPAELPSGITSEFYPCGDFHTVYFGEILGVYRR
jgi:flavin reductase (DIM6/NTAB) family NADH-FMN oxidoreductase RutF